MYKFHYLLLAIILFPIFLNAQNVTSELVNDALIKAKEQDKYVFVNYMSSSCEQSKKILSQLKSDLCKPLFDTSYILVNITLSDEEVKNHAYNTKKSSKNSHNSDFPFWYILDNNGSFIEISYDLNGNNLGYPENRKEVDQFMKVIKKTSKLSDVKLELMANSFHLKNNEKSYSSK